MSTKMRSVAEGSPPPTPITTAASLLLSLGLLYGICWSMFGKYVLPGGPLFAVLALGTSSYLGGRLIELLNISTLVGMMMVGFVISNTPAINIARDITQQWALIIRYCGLVLILLRAGLEIDSNVLKRKSFSCFGLVFIPFIVECCTAVVAAHFLLDMAWDWCFLLGFLLSIVSPEVVLSSILDLQKKGPNYSNDILTVVIAVAETVYVFSIMGFEVVLGLIFASGGLMWNFVRAPLQVLVGIVYGIILGIITWYLPNPEDKSCSVFRFLLLTFGGLFSLFLNQVFDFGAAGALGCMCLPLVAALRWKKGDWDPEENPVVKALSLTWRIIEPLFFGLVGSQIRLDNLDPSRVGMGLVTLIVVLTLRILACLLAGHLAGFTLKEQIFVALAGLPKSTAQATIGPVALFYVKVMRMGREFEQYAIDILMIAILSILITTPLGVTAGSFLASKLFGNCDISKKTAEVNDTKKAQTKFSESKTPPTESKPNIPVKEPISFIPV